jgi:hypothetical protein
MLSPQVLARGSEFATLHAVNGVLANDSYRLVESATVAEPLARVQREPTPETPRGNTVSDKVVYFADRISCKVIVWFVRFCPPHSST